MFRKILSVIFALFMFLPNIAHSAEMVNVEYIHQYLNARWGIDLPYNPELKNPRVAANMKYLLTVVDIANEYLNGEKTTNYGNGTYATLAAADTVATKKAIDTLISVPTFTITTTPGTSSFGMIIGAAGNFTIDWGDGQSEVITDKPIGATTYSHTYTTSGEYEIKLTGRATDYSDMDTGTGLVPTFALTDLLGFSVLAINVAKISGNLGKIFPTMDDGSNPNFFGTFMMAPITEIPADLFGELNGNGAMGMFSNTFSDCANLTTVGGPLFSGTLTPAEGMFAGTFQGAAITSIPANLFGTLNGDGAPSMFADTFSNCPNLTTIEGPLFSGTLTPVENMFAEMFSGSGITSIPENIFGNLTGDGTPNMFYRTFYNCKNLTTADGPLFSGTLTPVESMFAEMFSTSTITSIPENIFGNLTGDGTPSMFYQTFYNCKNLTTVGGPLFSGTLTPAERMFYNTFYNTALTEIPADLFAGIRGAPAKSMFVQTFSNTAITSIPDGLFAGIQGAPAEWMFVRTFSDTAITNIPANLFAGIQGAPAESMFSGTFSRTAITEIPADLFAGIHGAPVDSMFSYTFSNTAITEIPDGLFAGIRGAPAANMFDGTFYNTAITEIPADLFAGIQGAPAEYMFADTFSNTAITEIPADLFAGIQGAPAERMFERTFADTAITSIPANLFGTLNGDGARHMFSQTFYNCKNLTTADGPLFSGTITPAENMFYQTFKNTALTEIPADLFAGIQGAPATSMFAETFAYTPITSIPENLFAGISGPAANNMFDRTFSSCTSLTGPSARINGQYLYEIWRNVNYMNTYQKATGLSDYVMMPGEWK